VRRVSAAAALLAVAAVLAAIGCGGDDEPSAAEPTTTATATAPAPRAPETTPATTAEEPAGAGGVAAGRSVFMASCSGCHAGLGTRAAFGPRLSGMGLSEATIRATIRDGSGQMPAGLASGQDLEDVVAYVLSLQ